MQKGCVLKERPHFMKYLFFLLLFGLFSCEADNARVIVPETDIYINSYMTDCVGIGPMQCYLVQEGSLIGSDDWNLFYDKIHGFDYDEGFVYHLKVRIEKVANPPMDASSRKYVLLQIISKEVAGR